MQDVVSALETIISPEQNDAIVCNVNEKKELEKNESNSNLSKNTIDINYDLINDTASLNINEYLSKNKLYTGNNYFYYNSEDGLPYIILFKSLLCDKY